MKYAIVHNPTTNAIVLDDETGKQILPFEFAAAQRSKIKNYIDDGSLAVVDPDVIQEESSSAARTAKDEYLSLTAAWEAEKALPQEMDAEPATMTQTEKTSSSSKTTSKRN